MIVTAGIVLLIVAYLIRRMIDNANKRTIWSDEMRTEDARIARYAEEGVYLEADEESRYF